jgi:hypothetical protein
VSTPGYIAPFVNGNHSHDDYLSIDKQDFTDDCYQISGEYDEGISIVHC